MRELDRLAFFVLAHAELQVGVGELAEDAVGGAGHFALHGEQFFFAGAERVRLVANEAFELQLDTASAALTSRYSLSFLSESDKISGRMKLVASAASVAAWS